MWRSLLFLSVLLAAGCQTPMYSGSQCVLEPGSMMSMQSYAWKNSDPIEVIDRTGFVSPMVVRRLKSAVERELATKGFRPVRPNEDSADIDLAVTLRTSRELVSYEMDSQVCADSACWERANTGDNMRMETRTVGFLAADVYLDDAPVWRGWVETSLFREDRDDPSEVMGRAIPKLFETFPP